MEQPLIINPKTKVLQLITTYPQLEDVLIGYVPAFKKLKNPVLRNTVAKIATLQQAASIGNVKIEELINVLRKAVGQDMVTIAADSHYNTVKPQWFDAAAAAKELDIRPILAAGEHPVNQVIADLNQLPAGSIYKVTAPFLPAPLIDKAVSLGAEHYIVQEADELFTVYFFKPVG